MVKIFHIITILQHFASNKFSLGETFQKHKIIKTQHFEKQCILIFVFLHLYSAPKRSMSLRGKALAHGASARSMRSPNRKGDAGKGRPSRDWNVGCT